MTGVVFILEIVGGVVLAMLVLGWIFDRKPYDYLLEQAPEIQCGHCHRYRSPADLMWDDLVPVCIDTTDCHGPQDHEREAA